MNKELTKLEFIKSIEGNSDANMKHSIIAFNNGYKLSVIMGEHSYGGDKGLLEIALYNKDGDMDGSLFDEEDQGDNVLGYLSEEKVMYYVNKIGQLK